MLVSSVTVTQRRLRRRDKRVKNEDRNPKTAVSGRQGIRGKRFQGCRQEKDAVLFPAHAGLYLYTFGDGHLVCLPEIQRTFLKLAKLREAIFGELQKAVQLLGLGFVLDDRVCVSQCPGGTVVDSPAKRDDRKPQPPPDRIGFLGT